MEPSINVLPGAAAAAPQQAIPQQAASAQQSGGTNAAQGNIFAGFLMNATVKNSGTEQKTSVPLGLAQLAFLAQLSASKTDPADKALSTEDSNKTGAGQDESTSDATTGKAAQDETAAAALLGLVLPPPLLPVQQNEAIAKAAPQTDAKAADPENAVTTVTTQKQSAAVPTEAMFVQTAETQGDVAKGNVPVQIISDKAQSFAEAIQQTLTQQEKVSGAGQNIPVDPAGGKSVAANMTAETQKEATTAAFPVQTIHVMSDTTSFVKVTEKQPEVQASQKQDVAVQQIAVSPMNSEAQQGTAQGKQDEQSALFDGQKKQADDLPEPVAKNSNVTTAAFAQLTDTQPAKTATVAQSTNVQHPVADSYNLSGQIVEQAKLIKTPYSDASEMVIKLKPEHLGELTLRIAVDHGEVTASFHTNNPEVRGIIENSLPQLKQDMASQGIKVDNVGVYAGLSQFDSRGQQTNQQQPVIKFKNKRITDDDFISTVESLQAEQTGSDTGVDYRV